MRILISFVFGLMLPTSMMAASLTEQIAHDFKSGQISADTYALNTIRALFAPDELPARYQNGQVKPVKCGTSLLQEIRERRHTLSTATQQVIESYLQRPILSEEYISPSGRFKIHYDQSGTHAVLGIDIDRNLIPDFVEVTGTALDHSYRLLIDTLGYQVPPQDKEVDGPEFDMYLLNINTYGMTQPEYEISKGPSVYTSYMSMNNRFGAGFATTGHDAVRVTCVHEFFHMIQLGYAYRAEDLFFMEMSSTWIEDYAYDDVNDYYYYLTEFFRNTDIPFNSYGVNNHEYGACLWNHMLEKKYGEAIIHSIWEFVARYPVLEAMDYALIQEGSSFHQELESFSIWNFFTNIRSDPVKYYPEGEHYPLVKPRREWSFQTDVAFADSIQAFANAYYYFQDSDNQRDFALIIQHLNEAERNNAPPEKYHLDVLSYALSSEQRPVDTKLYVQLNADELNAWRGNVVSLYYDGTNKVNSFSSGKSPEIPKVRIFPNPYIIGQDEDFKIEFMLDQREWVEISIMNMHGQIIKSINIEGILPGFLDAGFHPEGEWDGTNKSGDYVGSGVYIVCLKTDSFVEYRKIAVVRE